MNPFSIEYSISSIKSFTDPIIFCSLPFSYRIQDIDGDGELELFDDDRKEI
jgi:hypothetical protein